jgi:hypothetical protein
MRQKIPGLLSLLFITITCPLISTAQGVKPLLGRWDLVVQGTDAPYTSWLEVTSEADGRLNGRFVGRFGSVRPIRELSFDQGTLNFQLPRQFEARKADLVFTGKLENGRLSGTTIGEDGKTLTWTGVPAPALPARKSLQWGKPIQLFNGRDLNGWRLRSEKNPGCWSVEDGTLTNSKGCVDIISEAKFSDFKLKLEFKMAEPVVNGGQRSNSGVYLRGRYEIQIQDDFGKPAESHGAGGLYGFLTPTSNAIRKAGEWQTYEITLIGRQLTVVLNGMTIIDRQEIPGLTGGAIDSAEGTPGPIMLQGDHGKVWFRNVVLTEAR